MATSSRLDTFGTWAANQAMEAAADFMAHERLTPTNSLFKRITSAMRASVKIALSEALADGKEALDAGMFQLAGPTMAATFRLAGISAVKEVMCWSGCECDYCTSDMGE